MSRANSTFHPQSSAYFRGENVIAKDPNSDSSTLCRKKSVVALIGITPVHPPPKASPYCKKSVVAWSGVPPLTPEPLRRKKEKSAYLKGGLRRQGGGAKVPTKLLGVEYGMRRCDENE